MGRFRAVAVLATVVGVFLASAAPAFAHAAYKDSDPPDGGTVSSPPGRVTATFTEPLAEGSFLQITDPCGDRVDGGDVEIVGYDMSVSMSGDAAGTYTVFYKAFSSLDPHVTFGEFTFDATVGGACAGATEPDDGDGGDATEDEGSIGTDSEEAPSRSSDSGSDPVSGAAGSGDKGDGEASRPGRGTRAERDGPTRGPDADEPSEEPELGAAADPAPEPSVWEGIRMEPFLTGLLLAAIVGAAGGKIYAGIMGPRA